MDRRSVSSSVASKGGGGGSRVSTSTLYGAKKATFRSPTPSPTARPSISTRRSGGGFVSNVSESAIEAGSDWDGTLSFLKSYGVPIASLALCGAGAV